MKELFANADAGMTGLLFFFILFMGITVWSFLPRNKQTIESYKFIPLREDNNHDLT